MNSGVQMMECCSPEDATLPHLDKATLLAALVESAQDAIVAKTLDGRITFWNRGAERLFGFAAAEMIGEKIRLLVPPDRWHEEDEFLASLRAGNRIEHYETVRVRSDGKPIDVSLSVSPIKSADGTIVGGATIARDITARKEAEERLQTERKQAADILARQTRELERSNAELEQFAYIASHDLQEPLRMVVSYTELLEERNKGRLDAKTDKFIRYIVEGGKRMQELVGDLLAYSRVGRNDRPFEAVDTALLAQRVLAGLQSAIVQSGAEIVCGQLPTITGDHVQLGQVFQNLIVNAIKFRAERPPRICVDAESDGRDWLFSVKDNGIGIELEYADRIFQMFQRLHERAKYEGNGLGLALAKKIVERHHGRIWFESEVGNGTTFYFTVPRMGEDAP